MSREHLEEGQNVEAGGPPIHHCHARDCLVAVPPHLLMCARHWAMVPRPLQRRIWPWFRRGQERDKRPSMEYIDAAKDAIAAVAEAEGARYVESQLVKGARDSQ